MLLFLPIIHLKYLLEKLSKYEEAFNKHFEKNNLHCKLPVHIDIYIDNATRGLKLKKTPIGKNSNLKSYTVHIADHIYKLLEEHIHMMKCLEDKSYTRQNWVINALKEKLHRSNDKELLLKDRHLQLKLDQLMHENIESKVKLIKNFRRTYSRKKWIVEAIYEQLEREKEKAKQLLQALHNKSKESN